MTLLMTLSKLSRQNLSTIDKMQFIASVCSTNHLNFENWILLRTSGLQMSNFKLWIRKANNSSTST